MRAARSRAAARGARFITALLLAALSGPAAALNDGGFQRVLVRAGCPGAIVTKQERLREPRGHEGHADATVTVVACPGGRSLTVTCAGSGCRLDPPRATDER